MSITPYLIDDVWDTIFRHVRNRDRFGRLALASREFHRLAFSTPIFSLDLFSIPRFSERFRMMHNSAIFWLRKQHADAVDGAGWAEVCRAHVDDLFSSSYFLSSAPLASVRVLELSVVPEYFIQNIAKYFSGVKFIKIGHYSDIFSSFGVDVGASSKSPFSQFSTLHGISIVMATSANILYPGNTLKYFHLEFFSPGLTESMVPLLESSTFLESLALPTLPSTLSLAKFPRLTDLKLAICSNPDLFNGFAGKSLRKLLIGITGAKLFPDLSPLGSALSSLILTESPEHSAPLFSIPASKLSQLKLQSLALLGSDMALALESFASMSTITDLSVNAQLLDDHFLDKFYGSLRGFQNMTSLSLLGPLGIVPLKRALQSLPNLQRFCYEDFGAMKRFLTLRSQSVLDLISSFPIGSMTELKLNMQNDVFTPEVLEKLSALTSLRLLRLRSSSISAGWSHWLRCLGQLKELRELEVSRTEFFGFPIFSENDIRQILDSLPFLRTWFLGKTSKADLLTASFIRDFPSLENFDVKPWEEPMFHPDFVDIIEEEEEESSSDELDPVQYDYSDEDE